MASADTLLTPNEAAADLLVSAFATARGVSAAALPDNAVSFVRQAQADWAAEELPCLTVDDVAGALAGLWQFGLDAPSGPEPAIRLHPLGRVRGTTSATDLLEIVQPDRPFLVDSVMAAIGEGGFGVRAMFHPIVQGGAGPYSMIQVWLERVGDDREGPLLKSVGEALADVRLAVDDFGAMRALMRRTIDELANSPVRIPFAVRQEYLTFLNWLEGDRFVFLGARVYEYPRTEDGGYAAEEPDFRPEDGYGVLRDPERVVLRRSNEPAVLTQQVRGLLTAGEPVVVAKSNLRSRVHRRVYADYIGVRRYGNDGRPDGEVRIVGLFTAEAYETPARDVPLIRRKVAQVMVRAGYAPDSHNAKRLRNILETWPRDELFQVSEDELLGMATGVLHLFDRPRVRLFARTDPFDRFISVLMYVPRERYDTDLRIRAGAVLAEAYGGRIAAYYPHYGDAPLARVHFIVGVRVGERRHPDLVALEARIADAARTWADRFEAAVRFDSARTDIGETLARYANAFPPGYRDQYDSVEALADIEAIDAMAHNTIRVRAFRRAEDSPGTFRFKLYRPGAAAPLADVLPVLAAMGLKALIEDGHRLTPSALDCAAQPIWVHEFVLQDENGTHLTFTGVQNQFEEAFTAIWNGRAESDGFNRLVLELGISWREAALVRALARYRQQTGLDPSQAVQERAVADYPQAARLILDLFAVKFDPAVGLTDDARRSEAEQLFARITAALQNVESLDADRVLRRLASLVHALQRTNFYQRCADGTPKPHISFKIASRDLADLPLPKPFREIYVSAPHVEGVHLRFGPVARGGLRWSDRRDDFRTEVLGLVKAQQVKNAVIVPVGSKGGFYPKQLPRGGDAAAIRAEAVRAYKTFLNGLLDITDNINTANDVVPPADTVVHDGHDPYLVVAADKGTATFSDIANEVAENYNFWLGDAFASGGSAGYDHKAMGITARGAWEAIKRHFRELGKDIQAENFTVAGVGDMSGDVFGNGMLLSKHIQLVAAFDHRHIFIDPTPDPASSWEERARLFALSRSSWNEYDRTRISAGGGIFSRSLKTIPLNAQMRALLDLQGESVSPDEVMHAILKAQVELLYFGGIGCYVKARAESNAEAGDKTNDAIRVNGADLRAKIIGEGANLGLTQAGRIEYALAGGRLNTDAIDNSAGVDTSDHEVNIKILTGALERGGTLDRQARNALLASMTDDIASHVLHDNYAQTLALSITESEAVGELSAHARFMTDLEAEGKLDRRVEGLPDAAVLLDREKSGQGLTRPELAVLLAYGKLDLDRDIVESDAPDDTYFRTTLQSYFPPALHTYGNQIEQHRLKREIIATVLANDMVNMCGPTFARRLRAGAVCDTTALVQGFAAGRAILGFDPLWDEVGVLDGHVPTSGQLALYRALAYALRSVTFWMARRAFREKTKVQTLIDRYRPAVEILKPLLPTLLSPFEQHEIDRRAQRFTTQGAPQGISREVASLQPLTTVADLVDLARGRNWPVEAVARLYHQAGAAFAFDRLRFAAGGFIGGDAFERLAVRRLIEDMLGEQATITQSLMSFTASAQAGESEDDANAAIASWSALRRERIQAALHTIERIESAGGGWTFAKLTIANSALRELASS